MRKHGTSLRTGYILWKGGATSICILDNCLEQAENKENEEGVIKRLSNSSLKNIFFRFITKNFQKNITMNKSEQIKKAITNYLNSLKELKQLGIIRTKPSLGDIGEFLCLLVYPDLELAESPINPCYDAFFNEKKIQIKFTDSSSAGNFNVGDPNNYDELIFITGPNSCHRNPSEPREKKTYIFFIGIQIQK